MSPSTISYKKIIVMGDPIYKERPMRAIDVYGVGAITPGMLCEYDTSEITPHGTAAGTVAPPIFAIEAPYRLGADIDTEYDQDGETVSYAFCRQGDEVYALLAVGENVAANATLESDGAGSLQASTTGRIVCRALEAVNNSGGSAPARILVEVF